MIPWWSIFCSLLFYKVYAKAELIIDSKCQNVNLMWVLEEKSGDQQNQGCILWVPPMSITKCHGNPSTSYWTISVLTKVVDRQSYATMGKKTIGKGQNNFIKPLSRFVCVYRKYREADLMCCLSCSQLIQYIVRENIMLFLHCRFLMTLILWQWLNLI